MPTIAALLDIPEDAPAGWPARLAALLDADETRRLPTFQRESSRQQFIAVHALARVLLSTVEPTIPPAGWRFERDAFGKPRLADDLRSTFGLSVNWSHADGMVAAVVGTGGEVGIDVERWDRPIDLAAMAKALTPAEHARLAMLNETDRRRAFFDLWTVREAYAKTIGRGVGIDFRSIAIDANAGRVRGHDGECTFAQFDAPPSHLAAVAMTRPLQVHFERWSLDRLIT